MVLVFVGTFLRSYTIASSLNGDEIFSYHAAAGTLSHAIRVAIEDRTHPPLHLVLLHYWLRVFHSPGSIRVVSIVASCGFLVLVQRVALRFVRPGWALFVAAICAVSPYFVYYGQEARPYALISLCGTLTMYLLLRMKESPSQLRWAPLWGLSCALLMWSQYIGLLLIIPELLFVCYSDLPGKRRALACGVAGTFSIAPWLVVVGTGLLPAGLDARLVSMHRPQLMDIPTEYIQTFAYWGGAGHTAAHSIAAGAIAVAAVALVSSRKIFSVDIAWIVAAATLPVITTFLVSRLGSTVIWASRQLILAGVCFLVLFAAGLSRYRSAIAIPVAVMLLCLAIVSQLTVGATLREPEWRDIAQAVQTHQAQPVVEEPFALNPLMFYLNRPVQYVGDLAKARRDFYYLPEFPTGVPDSPRVAYLCRPAHCSGLAHIRQWYDLTGSEPEGALTIFYLSKR